MYLHPAAALGYKDAVVRNPRRTGGGGGGGGAYTNLLCFVPILLLVYMYSWREGDVAQWLEHLTFLQYPRKRCR